MVKRVTYFRIGKVLATLGFRKIERDEFTAFENAEYDAFIVLPKGSGASIVRPAQLLGIEKTLTGKGITSSSAFARAISNARRVPASRSAQVKAKPASLAEATP